MSDDFLKSNDNKLEITDSNLEICKKKFKQKFTLDIAHKIIEIIEKGLTGQAIAKAFSGINHPFFNSGYVNSWLMSEYRNTWLTSSHRNSWLTHSGMSLAVDLFIKEMFDNLIDVEIKYLQHNFRTSSSES